MHKMKLRSMKSGGRLGYGKFLYTDKNGIDHYAPGPLDRDILFKDLAWGTGLPALVNTAQILLFPTSNPVWGLVASGAASAGAAMLGEWPTGVFGGLQSVLLYWMRTEQQNKVSFSNPGGQGAFQR